MAYTYKDKALDLFRAGFDPLPLIGKRPKHQQWTTMELDEATVKRLMANGSAGDNVGIRCSDDVHLIDVDITDKEMAGEIASWIDAELGDGNPFSKRIGAAPKFGIVCTIDGLKAKAKSPVYADKQGQHHHIEVLAKGQQFVAYGIHPDTGTQYTWTGPGPEHGGIMGLPTIPELDIMGLFDRFAELAEAAGWTEYTGSKAPAEKRERSGDPFADLNGPPPSIEELKRALSLVPEICWDDYEQWVLIGMAIHHTTGGSREGMLLWNTGSKVSDKYQGLKEIEAKWRSFRRNSAEDEAVTFGSLWALLSDHHDDEKIRKIVYDGKTSSYEDVDNVDNVDSVVNEDTCGQDVDKDVDKMWTTAQADQCLYGATANDIKEYIDFHAGDVVFSQLCQDIGLKTRREKKTANEFLRRMVENKELLKHPVKRGVYCTVVDDIERMCLDVGEIVPLPFRLPMDMHRHFNLLPGSTIIIGGSTNAGKTLLGLNMLRLFLEDLSTCFDLSSRAKKINHSLRSFTVSGCPVADPFPMWDTLPEIRFLNSEMSEHELVKNLQCMGPAYELLKNNVQWIKRSHDYPRAIAKDSICIVDFLQIHKDFYEIGHLVQEMADKIGNGLLVTLIQKKSGESAPRGGDFALERCRLAWMLDYAGPGISSCYMRKVKYPTNPANNPQGMEIDFRFGPNLAVEPVSELRRLSKKEREAVNASYARESRFSKPEGDFNGQF